MSAILQRIFPPAAGMVTSGQCPPPSIRKNAEESKIGESANPNTTPLSCELSSEGRILLHGPDKINNTALLFQCAISFAMEGQVVMFITQERFSALPVSVEGAGKPDPALMKQVHIKYLSDRSSFLKELSRIHITSPAPDIIIVESLDYYISNPKTSSVGQVTASLCAHLVDASSFLYSKRSKSDSTSSSSLSTIPSCLMASFTTQSSNTMPTFHDVYSQFFPTTFSITDLADTKMKQLQCWLKDEELPQYVVTFEVGSTIKIVDVMVGPELDADWSQTSSMVT